MWDIQATDEYLEWFNQQSVKVKEVILAKVVLLQAFGPQLGRPHADTLKGSSVKNLKELRVHTGGQVCVYCTVSLSRGMRFCLMEETRKAGKRVGSTRVSLLKRNV